MGRDAPAPPYSMVWLPVLHAASSAGLTRSELCALLYLMRDQRKYPEVSQPAADIAGACGLSLGTVRNALSSLCSKEFEAPDGTRLSVLTRTREAHRNSPAAYRLNVPREWGAGGEGVPRGRFASSGW